MLSTSEANRNGEVKRRVLSEMAQSSKITCYNAKAAESFDTETEASLATLEHDDGFRPSRATCKMFELPELNL